MSEIQSAYTGVSEEQWEGIQQELAEAFEDAYGKNKFACVLVLACFVCGIDNSNLKKICVSYFYLLKYIYVIFFVYLIFIFFVRNITTT